MFEPVYVPNWMRDLKEEVDAEESRREATDDRRALAQLKVQTGGPTFWENLCKELTLSTLALPQIQLGGTVFSIHRSKEEESVRIIIRRNSVLAASTHVDLVYRNGGPTIQARAKDGSSTVLEFCVSSTGDLGVISREECHIPAMTAEKTAEFILRPMVKAVKEA